MSQQNRDTSPIPPLGNLESFKDNKKPSATQQNIVTDNSLNAEEETPSRSVDRLIQELLPDEDPEPHVSVVETPISGNSDICDYSSVDTDLTMSGEDIQLNTLRNRDTNQASDKNQAENNSARKNWKRAFQKVTIRRLALKHNRVDIVDENSDGESTTESAQLGQNDPNNFDDDETHLQSMQPPNNGSEDPNRTRTQLAVPYLTPLHQYSEISHIFCLNPYPPQPIKSNWRYLQYMIFGIVAILSILHGIGNIITFAIHEASPSELIRYIETAFFLVHLISKAYLVKVLIFDHRKISQLLSNLATLYHLIPKKALAAAEAKWKMKWYRKAFHTTTIVFITVGAIPFLLSIIRGVFDVLRFDEWSMSGALQQSAGRLGRILFVWGTGDLKNATDQMITDLLETNETAGWISLGSFGFVLEICGSWQEYAMRDLVMMLAETLSTPCHIFIIVTKTMKGRTLLEEDALTNADGLNEIWEFYERLRLTFQETNRCFGPLMRLLHINNMLLIAHFILLCIKGTHTEVSFILGLYNICKTLYTYYVAAKISETNNSARTWIKGCAGHRMTLEIHGESREVQSLLDDIRQTPIGLGTGEFLINESFLMRFFGLTSSLLLFLVEADRDNDHGADNENNA